MPPSELPKLLLPHTAKSHRMQGLSSLIMGSFTALPQNFHRESLWFHYVWVQDLQFYSKEHGHVKIIKIIALMVSDVTVQNFDNREGSTSGR